ncbi:MAG: hypothetical protein SFW08_06585 [Gemmatimonadaceae bacterium]|nr:hypothetical protein [Gemmatimonadaceae bacterium]
MPRRWTVLFGALCAVAAVRPSVLEAQKTDRGQKPPAVSMGQNAPNPFGTDTRIPFTVGDPATCKDPVKTYRVTLRVYNLLSQVVAVPVLVSGPAGLMGNVPTEGVALPCGAYLAYWDGRYLSTGSPAAASIYLYRIEVEGTTLVRKMVLAR